MKQNRRSDQDSDSREARLAAALRANLARRKAQARARAADEADPENGQADQADKDGQN
ncbi:MAG: hypothetical protein Q4G14_02280 [Paracoccus sp. (in: a-proteobacteria)]|uniref:hypothetical protein n=1 Tax=Paracoccus sp. TaxID=267 RepID=UPI0026E06853|nr:hypothetical protein [Paracoccus sp. (in: a-proteobacteria)]MDO5612051.1 hypothetical protein [Paracoccus sp. (in: a-proteobacteria)]